MGSGSYRIKVKPRRGHLGLTSDSFRYRDPSSAPVHVPPPSELPAQPNNAPAPHTESPSAVSALAQEDLWSREMRTIPPLPSWFRCMPHSKSGTTLVPATSRCSSSGFWGIPNQLPQVWIHLEFSYLVARFAVLKAQRDGCDPMTERTRNWLDREIDTFLDSPAWQWEEPAFPNVPERIAWRLSADGHSIHKYQRALIDEDLFVMAIAADIKTVNAICGVPSSPLMTDAVDLAARSFDEQVVWTPTGGWLMQPGQWSDHPDYLYAGNAVVESSLEPSPIGDLAADSSHSHRLGLWLVSLRCEAETEGNLLQVRKYDELLHGLDAQLATVVATRTFRRRLSDQLHGRPQWGLSIWVRNPGPR